MEKKTLNRYLNKKKELNTTEKILKKLRERPKIVADCVKDYKTGYAHTVKVEGYDVITGFKIKMYEEKKAKLEKEVLQILSEHKELTAKQVARYMFDKKNTKNLDYNHARPRLTALLEKREVCIVGKELNEETHCKEAVYRITQKGFEALNMNHIPRLD